MTNTKWFLLGSKWIYICKIDMAILKVLIPNLEGKTEASKFMKYILGSEHASFFIIFWRYTFNELGSFLSHYDAMESVNTQTTPYGCHPYAVSRIFTVFLRNLLSKFNCQFSLTSKGICLTRMEKK